MTFGGRSAACAPGIIVVKARSKFATTTQRFQRGMSLAFRGRFGREGLRHDLAVSNDESVRAQIIVLVR